MKVNMADSLKLMRGDTKSLSDEQKEAIIHNIWQYAENMVDESFAQHPTQQALEQQSAKILQFPNKRLDSKDTFNQASNREAANDNDFAKERKKHA